MIREKAFKLAGAVADAGFSCSATIGVHPDKTPVEHCSVSVKAMRLDGPHLQALGEIGAAYGCDLHFIAGDGLSFFEMAGGA